MISFQLSFLESGRQTFGEPPYVVRIAADGIVQIIDKDNSEYLAWLAEGNTPEEWQPETIEPSSEPVIEETPADSTDEEPVTEDGN